LLNNAGRNHKHGKTSSRMTQRRVLVGCCISGSILSVVQEAVGNLIFHLQPLLNQAGTQQSWADYPGLCHLIYGSLSAQAPPSWGESQPDAGK
jgi:hypothetical protein